MKELFVPYALAVKLKEKGFDELCFRYHCKDNADRTGIKDWMSDNLYSEVQNSSIGLGNVAAPLYQQVVDWFREEHSLHIYLRDSIFETGVEYRWRISKIKMVMSIPEKITGFSSSTSNQTYYEALDKAIEEALKLI